MSVLQIRQSEPSSPFGSGKQAGVHGSQVESPGPCDQHDASLVPAETLGAHCVRGADAAHDFEAEFLALATTVLDTLEPDDFHWCIHTLVGMAVASLAPESPDASAIVQWVLKKARRIESDYAPPLDILRDFLRVRPAPNEPDELTQFDADHDAFEPEPPLPF